MSSETRGEGGELELLGTGEQLRAHIEAWEAGLDESQRRGMSFNISMGKLLADRLQGDANPLGFIIATDLLVYDCMSGVNGFTGQPMPADVSGYPRQMYAIFGMQSTEFARGAFGDAYADGLTTLHREIAAEAQRQ